MDRCLDENMFSFLSLLIKDSTLSIHFPFLGSAHLYRRAEESKGKVQTWSDTPHLIKVIVSRVRHLVGKWESFRENKTLTTFNIQVWRAR